MRLNTRDVDGKGSRLGSGTRYKQEGIPPQGLPHRARQVQKLFRETCLL